MIRTTEIEREIAEEDEVRSLLARDDAGLVPPPYAVLERRTRRSRPFGDLIAVATAVVVLAIAAGIGRSLADLRTSPSGAASRHSDGSAWVGDRRHVSGLVVLAAQPPTSEPLPEPLAKAVSDARWLAESYGDAFGYPWADRAVGEVVVAIADPSGDAIARTWIQAGIETTVTDGPKAGSVRFLAAPAVPVRLRAVAHSYRSLERIKDEAISLRELPDAAAIYATEPDDRDNRVIITVDRMSDPLFHALAARYGTEAIAIRVDPNRPAARPGGSEPVAAEHRLLLGAAVVLLAVPLLLRFAIRRRRFGTDSNQPRSWLRGRKG